MSAVVLAVALAAAAGALLPGRAGSSTRVTATPAPARVRRSRAGARLRGARAEAELRAQLGELLCALAAELRGGADPRAALVAAAEGLPRLVAVATASAAPAGEVVPALRALAVAPGGRTAGMLAVAWDVAERTGAPLAGPVLRLHAAHRAQDRARREVAAQLAGPRATARLLAVLPLLGVALGSGLGADPVQFLLGTPAGRACLAGAGLLVALGLRWTERIVRSVHEAAGGAA